MSEAPKVIWAQQTAVGWEEPHSTIYQVNHFHKYHHDDTVVAHLATIEQQQAEIERLREALTRIETPMAFHVPTAHVDPEAYARMIFAEQVGRGKSVKDAETIAEKKTRARYERKALDETQ